MLHDRRIGMAAASGALWGVMVVLAIISAVSATVDGYDPVSRTMAHQTTQLLTWAGLPFGALGGALLGVQAMNGGYARGPVLVAFAVGAVVAWWAGPPAWLLTHVALLNVAIAVIWELIFCFAAVLVLLSVEAQGPGEHV